MDNSVDLELALQEAQHSRYRLFQLFSPLVENDVIGIKTAIDFHLSAGFHSILTSIDPSEEEFLDRLFEGKEIPATSPVLVYKQEEPDLALVVDIEDAMLGVFDAFFKVSMRKEMEVRELISKAREIAVIPFLEPKLKRHSIK